MVKELYAVRLEPEMKKEIVIISKVLHVSESEWIRNKLAYDIRETMDTLRTQIALEYVRGNIKESELKEIFGDETVKIIKFASQKVKREIADAKKLAKKIRHSER